MLMDTDDLIDILRDKLKIKIDTKRTHPLYDEAASTEIVVSLEFDGEVISESSLPIG